MVAYIYIYTHTPSVAGFLEFVHLLFQMGDKSLGT